MRVLTAVKKDILSKVVIENRTELVSHPYCMVLDIRELHPQSGKPLRRTRVINLYDNKVGKGSYGTDLVQRYDELFKTCLGDQSSRVGY